jgi:hypothetical protein
LVWISARYSRNRSTREYSIRPMDFMFATAPIPAGTALPSKWRSLILSLIVQRRRQNTFHSKDLCEYRRPNSDIRTPRVPIPIQPGVRLPMSNTANEDASQPSFPFGSAGNLRGPASKCHGNRSELELEGGSKQQGGYSRTACQRDDSQERACMATAKLRRYLR